jgi:alpha-amylase
MTSICLYFKVHQPYRLKKYHPMDIDVVHYYRDDAANQKAISQLADECYLPANKILCKQILEHKGKLNVSFSISGTMLELLNRYRPDVLDSFKELVKTGCVEILAETYYHSLSSLHSIKEFKRQVEKHANLVKVLFDKTTTVFRNTELIHNNGLAKIISNMGFKGLLCEGVERILKGRSPNNLFASPGNGDFGLLLRNVRLSDDIAFRFDDESWNEHPLTAEKFAEWLHTRPATEDVINLMFDYETFGVHKKSASGIFEFLDALPAEVLKDEKFIFSTPSFVIKNYYPKGIYDTPSTISWEDRTDASCVWCENMMQNNTLKKIYSVERMVLASKNQKFIDKWGMLQSADYFYYMSEESCKAAAYKHYNPFLTPADAFQNYSNIIADFEISLIKYEITRMKKKSPVPTHTNNLF